jgi:hypothetical protein
VPEIDGLRRKRQRLVRLAAATDDPVSEVVDALRANQDRAKALEHAHSVATRPPIEPAIAERLENVAVAHIEVMRQRLRSDEAREALKSLFPGGLRFKVGSGLWLIEGSASVPNIKNPDHDPAAGRGRTRLERIDARVAQFVRGQVGARTRAAILTETDGDSQRSTSAIYVCRSRRPLTHPLI